MKLSFTKMHGIGNDFVVIDATERRFQPPPGLLAHLGDRRFGVGCDQILVVEAPSTPDVDFDYRIFNADGSEVGQCGNGSRALARYVQRRGLSAKRQLRVRTQAATLSLELLDDGQVRVDMGAPRLEPAQVPLLVERRAPRYSAQLADGTEVSFGAASMGNPHAVLQVANVDTAPVSQRAPLVQGCGLFPDGVNVGFMQLRDAGSIALRVYERGVGETLACGTGACAAVVVGRLWGLLNSEVEVRLRGGRLRISWAGEGQPVLMTGPAEFVYTGEIEWSS